MPVFDFTQIKNEDREAAATWTIFRSSEPENSPEKPVLVLASAPGHMKHHIVGVFSPVNKRTAFEFDAEEGDVMRLTSLQSITDFLVCAGRTLPDNIRLWARRNLAVARSQEVSPEERRHAQRALSIAEISDRFAFSNPSNFSAVFKKVTGQTPAEYQGKMKK
jgi:AraC-like DNA-binding protein